MKSNMIIKHIAVIFSILITLEFSIISLAAAGSDDVENSSINKEKSSSSFQGAAAVALPSNVEQEAKLETMSDDLPPAKQCELNGLNYEAAIALVQQLQQALKVDDKKAVVALASYPLRVNTQHPAQANNQRCCAKVTHYFIANQQQLITQYNSLFTPQLKATIFKVNPQDISCSWRGGMIADGAVWFADKGGVHFFAINK